METRCSRQYQLSRFMPTSRCVHVLNEILRIRSYIAPKADAHEALGSASH
jgi:hypothetical protein